MKTEQLHIRITPDEKARLAAIAVITNRSMSGMIRHWVNSFPETQITLALTKNPALEKKIADMMKE